MQSAILLLLCFTIACQAKSLASQRMEMPLASPQAASRDSGIALSNAAFAQSRSFISIEGPDLKSRMEAAVKQARSVSPPTRFWTAYSFDVRPGIAVDPGIGQFSGSMESFGGATIFIGTSNGMMVETRNLGVFVLREPGGSAISRVEIYNLERPREYSGYPVYWLGRAGNEESLDFLRGLIATDQVNNIAERATVAIGLHDDRRVGAILKELARSSALARARGTAIFWLGQAGGEQAFLADLVRNEQESQDVRRQAVSAIGTSRDAASLSALQGLYSTVANRQVREQIISAVARNENREAAVSYLSKIAQGDPDRELRKHAISRLGHLSGTQAFLASLVRNERESPDVREQAASAIGKSGDPAALATLQSLYRSVADRQVKEHLLNAASKSENQEAVDFLSQVARSDPDYQLRRQAVSRLGRLPGSSAFLADLVRNERESMEVRKEAAAAIGKSGDPAALPALQNLYGAVSSREVKAEIIGAAARNENEEAVAAFLIKVAQSEPDRRVKEEAISRLGRVGCSRCLQFLSELVNTSQADAEAQMQAVAALGRAPEDKAIPLLINIAKTHPRAEVRQEAIRRLRHKDDERVQAFLKEILSK